MTLRRVLVATAIFVAVLVLGFATVAVYESYQMRIALQLQAERLAQLERVVESHQKLQENRLDLIEAFVFGKVTSELLALGEQKRGATAAQSRAALDAWILRRDQEMRDRIKALERWRYEQLQEDEE
jgi:hypothetical protein